MAETCDMDDPRRSESVDPEEIGRFAAMAAEWWDPDGKFRPLHKMNPVRLGFVRDHLAAHFGRDPMKPGCLSGLRILDIGCGGGLLCEPLTRLGASMTGIDATEKTVSIARVHAEEMGLEIDYRSVAAEDLVKRGEVFDAVVCLEVVEHVVDPQPFLKTCCDLAKPGGGLVFSTINRTAKAFALGIVGAEYILRWLPRGTHQWRKFVRPSELGRGLRAAGVQVSDIQGASYDILTDDWRLGRDVSVNYLVFAEKP